jgi:hypothetical protein
MRISCALVDAWPLSNGGTNSLMVLNGALQRLQHVDPAAFRLVRQQTRERHEEQLNRSRFRHRPQEYLASLEKRWEQGHCTVPLPS